MAFAATHDIYTSATVSYLSAAPATGKWYPVHTHLILLDLGLLR
jgi:hypothetical protein